MSMPMLRSSIASGALLALIAAVLFGVTMPAVQWFGRGVGPFTTGALLYAGAAALAALLRPFGALKGSRWLSDQAVQQSPQGAGRSAAPA
jgi:hypothetical protein